MVLSELKYKYMKFWATWTAVIWNSLIMRGREIWEIENLHVTNIIVVWSPSCVHLFWHTMDYSPPGSPVHIVLRQEYWSELPFPSPRCVPGQGLNPCLLHCQPNSLPLRHQGSLCVCIHRHVTNDIQPTVEYCLFSRKLVGGEEMWGKRKRSCINCYCILIELEC